MTENGSNSVRSVCGDGPIGQNPSKSDEGKQAKDLQSVVHLQIAASSGEARWRFARPILIALGGIMKLVSPKFEGDTTGRLHQHRCSYNLPC